MTLKKAAPGGATLGGMVEPYQSWLAGERLKGEITQSTIDYKMELIDAIRGAG